MFEKKTLVIPDDAKFEERTILTVGDVILGNHVTFDFGVMTSGRFFAGESVEIDGDVQAEGEIRLDMFSHVKGNAVSRGDVYLGEKCKIDGTLHLEGDLDVGDDVQIKDGFEAKGWINIRNPIPLVIYIFIYLMELLRLGKSEEVERILRELEESAQDEILISDVFMYVPDGSRLGLTQSEIKGDMRVGSGCRVLGNFVVKGDVVIGKGTKLYGAIRATGGLRLVEGAEVQGEIHAQGPVEIGKECHVLGDLSGDAIEIHSSATVDGTLNAPNGVKFVTDKDLAMEEKVVRFEAGQTDDIVDLLR